MSLGCSFTYGSELLDPELDHSWDRHHENTPYREKYCWLGRLAERLSCKAINLSEPSCSNYAIQEKFADYIFRTYTEDTIIAVGWTSHLRMSWWDEDKSWIHDGNIRYNAEELFNKNSGFKNKRSEIVGNIIYTDSVYDLSYDYRLSESLSLIHI